MATGFISDSILHMEAPLWLTAVKLLEKGDLEGSCEIVNQGLAKDACDPGLLYAAGRLYLLTHRFPEAIQALTAALTQNPSHSDAKFALAWAYKQQGTHKGLAAARTILLDLINQSVISIPILRAAAECCSAIGPLEKSVELWRQVAAQEGGAEAYFHLSEALAATDRLAPAMAALRRACALDPERYQKSLHDLELSENPTERKRSIPIKKGRYPDTALIQGDLKRTIIEYLAADLHDAPKFIHRDTQFFTMGSCFARNIVRSLQKMSYHARHMEISEHINTTYANRHFVDWLEGGLLGEGLEERILELLPPGFSKETLLESFKSCDVFILTLGVAPAFFDRETGKFVMPRPTSLNTRALAEKYLFRTTTVEENVDNVFYLLSFVRKLNPKVKIVVTESPVPLMMTFEFKSAVVADCLSKSTLRLAAHQIVNHSGLRDIYYWPSFEVFRWLGGHMDPVYGVDDGAAWHVSEAIVDTVVKSFVEVFSEPPGPGTVEKGYALSA